MRPPRRNTIHRAMQSHLCHACNVHAMLSNGLPRNPTNTSPAHALPSVLHVYCIHAVIPTNTSPAHALPSVLHVYCTHAVTPMHLAKRMEAGSVSEAIEPCLAAERMGPGSISEDSEPCPLPRDLGPG